MMIRLIYPHTTRVYRFPSPFYCIIPSSFHDLEDMCLYENVLNQYTKCGHEVRMDRCLVRECSRYLRRAAKYYEMDQKWREGSQERCPPTPFNFSSCSQTELRPEMVSRVVQEACWDCAAKKALIAPQLRVAVRDWRDHSWRGLTPESEVVGVYGTEDGCSPLSPPASSSEADSEELESSQEPESSPQSEFFVVFA